MPLAVVSRIESLYVTKIRALLINLAFLFTSDYSGGSQNFPDTFSETNDRAMFGDVTA